MGKLSQYLSRQVTNREGALFVALYLLTNVAVFSGSLGEVGRLAQESKLVDRAKSFISEEVKFLGRQISTPPRDIFKYIN